MSVRNPKPFCWPRKPSSYVRLPSENLIQGSTFHMTHALIIGFQYLWINLHDVKSQQISRLQSRILNKKLDRYNLIIYFLILSKKILKYVFIHKQSMFVSFTFKIIFVALVKSYYCIIIRIVKDKLWKFFRWYLILTEFSNFRLVRFKIDHNDEIFWKYLNI